MWKSVPEGHPVSAGVPPEIPCPDYHAGWDPGADGGSYIEPIHSPGQHADLRHALPIVADLAASDLAADRGYVSAAFRASLAAVGCTVHVPPKRGTIDPPPWNAALCARRHRVETLFSRLKDPPASRCGATKRAAVGWASPISPPL